MILSTGRYFILTLVVGPTMLFVGAWLAAVGRPIDPATGRPAGWGNAGLVGAILLEIPTAGAGFVFLNG
jgi:hypothetical protein